MKKWIGYLLLMLLILIAIFFVALLITSCFCSSILPFVDFVNDILKLLGGKI